MLLVASLLLVAMHLPTSSDANENAPLLVVRQGREVVKEKCDTLYVGVGHHHKAMACVCHMQEGMHLMEVGKQHQR